ncbi:MAG: 2-phosphosulfolactate phosphatase [Actinomycetota bacterium]|nr:2-phosphosulfolactate phosphatase [Actinomycetota bacterium]
MGSRQVARWELAGVTGPVVVIDVIRAFTTAAYAFGAGAEAIYLVGGVDEALEFKQRHAGVLAMGEDHGRRPQGFDFANSPVALSRADLRGRTLVQRTSAGTQGVVAASHATRLWAASLVCASATAAAVTAAGLGDPTYVITGCFPDAPDTSGDDDRMTAAHIEAIRLGHAPDARDVAAALLVTDEAIRTLALGDGHCHPLDIECAGRVDAFDFAMEVTRDDRGLRLAPSFPPFVSRP